MIKSKAMFALLGVLLVLVLAVGVTASSTHRVVLLSLFIWSAILALGVVLYTRNISKSHSTGLRNAIRRFDLQIRELDIAIGKARESIASEVGDLAQRLDRDLSGVSDSLTSMKRELNEVSSESRKSRDAAKKGAETIMSSQESASAHLQGALERLLDLNVELVASLDKRLEEDRF